MIMCGGKRGRLVYIISVGTPRRGERDWLSVVSWWNKTLVECVNSNQENATLFTNRPVCAQCVCVCVGGGGGGCSACCHRPINTPSISMKLLHFPEGRSALAAWRDNNIIITVPRGNKRDTCTPPRGHRPNYSPEGAATSHVPGNGARSLAGGGTCQLLWVLDEGRGVPYQMPELPMSHVLVSYLPHVPCRF